MLLPICIYDDDDVEMFSKCTAEVIGISAKHRVSKTAQINENSPHEKGGLRIFM